MTRHVPAAELQRVSVGEALETALGALHYAGQRQRAADGHPLQFHDWGWVFSEITEILYAVNKTLDRQLADHARGPLPVDDHVRIRQIRSHLASIGVALADARTHASGCYRLAARLGSTVVEGAPGEQRF